MLMETTGTTMLFIATMFLAGFLILFLMYYFMPMRYTRHRNKKSRLIYSLFSALYFSLVLTILFAALPLVLDSSGVIATIVAGGIIVFVAVLLQVYIMREFVRRGIILIGSRPGKGVK